LEQIISIANTLGIAIEEKQEVEDEEALDR